MAPIPAPAFFTAHLRLIEDVAHLLGAKPATRSPRQRKTRPIRTEGADWYRLPAGTRELIIAFYDGAGCFLCGFGQTARPSIYVDLDQAVARGDPRGGRGNLRFDDRLLHLPVPEHAEYLVFFRADVVDSTVPEEKSRNVDHLPEARDSLRLSLRVLNAYALPWTGAPAERDDWPEFEWPIVGVDRSIKVGPQRFMPFPDWRWEPVEAAERRGQLAGFETVHGGAVGPDQFDIVLLGDGFAEQDQQLFLKSVEILVDGLLRREPFARLQDRINIHMVRALSEESGVSRTHHAPGRRHSYFAAEGLWREQEADPSSVGFCGTVYPGRIYEAAENFGPRDQVDLFLMLVNSNVYGGSAFYHLDLAFATLRDGADEFVDIVAHECGHAIGNLGEEYISILPYDPLAEHPNVVREQDKDAIWWSDLAEKEELDQSGRLKIRESFRDEAVSQGDEPVATTHSPEAEKALGLFWGAQFIELDDDEILDIEGFHPYKDRRGRHFYRPMRHCKMRAVKWPFCRVCDHVLAQAITNPNL